MRNWLFVFVLFLPSVCFGQQFQAEYITNFYNSNAYLNLSTDQAYLVYSYTPRGTITDATIVLGAQISSTFENLRYQKGSFGIYFDFESVGGAPRRRQCVSVISPSSIIFQGSSTVSDLLPQIQTLLESKNLGTIEQRAAYIASFKLKVGPLVDPSTILGDLQKLLGPWVAIGLGLVIALFGLDLGTRYMHRFAKQAVKEARAADRRERNKEIRLDPIAKQFREHMSELAMVSRNTYGIYSRTEQREARKIFEQAASDYAKYKKNRGWYA